MYVNEQGKFSSEAEYYYNDYIGMYCVVGTTFCCQYLDDLADLWESPELLIEVAMPDYITSADYEAPSW